MEDEREREMTVAIVEGGEGGGVSTDERRDLARALTSWGERALVKVDRRGGSEGTCIKAGSYSRG